MACTCGDVGCSRGSCNKGHDVGAAEDKEAERARVRRRDEEVRARRAVALERNDVVHRRALRSQQPFSRVSIVCNALALCVSWGWKSEK